MLTAWVLMSVLCTTVDKAPAGSPDAGAAPAGARASGPLLPSGTRSRQTPAVREPAKDKTTEPHDVDLGGSPRAQGREGLPHEMSDVPLSPPVAPIAEPKGSKSGGGPDKVNDIHGPAQ
jgi:hypothetical protein